MLESMHVEQRKRHKEAFRRRDEFEAAQEERFRVIHDHLTTKDDTFHIFASYSEQFNEIHHNITLNHVVT